jgi:hypothetical protein
MHEYVVSGRTFKGTGGRGAFSLSKELVEEEHSHLPGFESHHTNPVHRWTHLSSTKVIKIANHVWRESYNPNFFMSSWSSTTGQWASTITTAGNPP